MDIHRYTPKLNTPRCRNSTATHPCIPDDVDPHALAPNPKESSPLNMQTLRISLSGFTRKTSMLPPTSEFRSATDGATRRRPNKPFVPEWVGHESAAASDHLETCGLGLGFRVDIGFPETPISLS